jgi:hypothetical protein
MIGRWIDDMVQAQPEVMRLVAEKEFGDLDNWFDYGNMNHNINPSDVACSGCLVGSYVLATGAVVTRKDKLPELLVVEGGVPHNQAYRAVMVGQRVSGVQCQFRDRAIRSRRYGRGAVTNRDQATRAFREMLKARIRRALARYDRQLDGGAPALRDGACAEREAEGLNPGSQAATPRAAEPACAVSA